MAIIGTFTGSENGYLGTIRTLTINLRASIKPADKTSEKAPDYRVFSGDAEFGAAWRKTSAEGRDYLSLKLDEPSFAGPIFCNLIELDTDGSFNLVWSRPAN